MTAFRLTLDLDEETRARWQNAAHRYGWTVDEWVRDVCATASDPDAGQVVDCRARLTTAEQERNSALVLLGRVGQALGKPEDESVKLLDQVRLAAAAEARVEAAVVLLAREMYANEGILMAEDDKAAWDDDALLTDVYDEYLARARAALACPPQQRGE